MLYGHRCRALREQSCRKTLLRFHYLMPAFRLHASQPRELRITLIIYAFTIFSRYAMILRRYSSRRYTPLLRVIFAFTVAAPPRRCLIADGAMKRWHISLVSLFSSMPPILRHLYAAATHYDTLRYMAGCYAASRYARAHYLRYFLRRHDADAFAFAAIVFSTPLRHFLACYFFFAILRLRCFRLTGY